MHVFEFGHQKKNGGENLIDGVFISEAAIENDSEAAEKANVEKGIGWDYQ